MQSVAQLMRSVSHEAYGSRCQETSASLDFSRPYLTAFHCRKVVYHGRSTDAQNSRGLSGPLPNFGCQSATALPELWQKNGQVLLLMLASGGSA